MTNDNDLNFSVRATESAPPITVCMGIRGKPVRSEYIVLIATVNIMVTSTEGGAYGGESARQPPKAEGLDAPKGPGAIGFPGFSAVQD